jgi:hypothetical protein
MSRRKFLMSLNGAFEDMRDEAWCNPNFGEDRKGKAGNAQLISSGRISPKAIRVKG